MDGTGVPFDPDRAVRLLQDGRHKASGYLLTGNLVLTCQHFLHEGRLDVVTRDGAHSSTVDERKSFPEEDVALLTCAHPLGDWAPISLGVVEQPARRSLVFEMYGWPLWSAEASDDGLLEGGRLIRGVFEPSDTSAEGNLVLQPSRTGGGVQTGWSGMSGAAVFSLDRLVGVQRRQLHPQDPASIEARPIGVLAGNPVFEKLMAGHGVGFERGWAPGIHESSGEDRFEVHGPHTVALLSPTLFHVRSEGWHRVSYSFRGAGNEIGQQGSVDAAPLVDIRAFFGDVNQIGAKAALDVEVFAPSKGTRTLSHEFEVRKPGDADLAAAFETTLRVLERAKAGGSPSENLRGAKACAAALARLRGAIGLVPISSLTQQLQNGITGAQQCLAIERSHIEQRLRDQDTNMSTEDQHDSKYAYHRAYTAREYVRERGLGQAISWGPQEEDAQMPVLGYRDKAEFYAYLQPSLEAQLSGASSFMRGFLSLLLASETVNIHGPDFTSAVPQVQGELYDVVNALITEGWARWETTVYNLTLTQVGRHALPKVL